MERITSRDNRRIKEAAKLAKDRAFREEQGLFLLEGLRLCADVAATTGKAETLFFTEKALQRWPEELNKLQAFCRESFLISGDAAAKLAETKTSQEVFLICRKGETPDWEYTGNERILVLEQVSDPGNMGTILRTAEAFGVTRLLISADSVDLYSPKVLRASMGSAFRLPVQICADLRAELRKLMEKGVRTYAATLSKDSLPLDQVSLAAPVACVVGNEGNGITQETAALCHGRVIIPMEGQIESLNVAVAATVLLWEMKKGK